MQLTKYITIKDNKKTYYNKSVLGSSCESHSNKGLFIENLGR